MNKAAVRTGIRVNAFLFISASVLDKLFPENFVSVDIRMGQN
jgi:hypothetical protein